jgi:tetraacyldisaccharide 4'-kinase
MNFRLLLLPFSLVYGIVIFVRNRLFDFGILKENKFDVPVIGIGNITTGGTGKTPHVEYLIRLFSSDKNIATLSRGYGRKTSGFLYVSDDNTTEMVGDEPLQLKNKFKEITVAVSEKRKEGINKILKDNPQTSVVLLDDAFQHRAVKPGLSILLLDYLAFFKNNFLLPAGNMREPFSEKKRADIIVVSKCTHTLQDDEKKIIIERISPDKMQNVFFSSVVYAPEIKAVFSSEERALTTNLNTLLVTGIADASGVKAYTETKTKLAKHLEFSDHHQFSGADIRNIIEIFSTIATENKIILTTEKDAMRFKVSEELKKLPLYYLPVEIKFHKKDKNEFNKLILQYVGKN